MPLEKAYRPISSKYPSMVVIIFPWPHSSMNSVSSRRQVMKGSRNPLMMEVFWMGMMILVIRFHQGMSWMIAASSISPLSCIMEFRALRLAKGMYLTTPAKISSIKINEEEKKAEVFMQPDQVSLAIGKGGYNIKLASKLVGYEIEVFRDTDEDYDDVALQEFNDEIEQWVIDELIKIGCDTAKSVLALPKEELMIRTDLEEETIDHVLEVLKSEFE